MWMHERKHIGQTIHKVMKAFQA